MVESDDESPRERSLIHGFEERAQFPLLRGFEAEIGADLHRHRLAAGRDREERFHPRATA